MNYLEPDGQHESAFLLTLPPRSAALYRDWLDGDQTPEEIRGGKNGNVIYIVTPSPWSFWIGVGVVSQNTLVPLLMFKNVVPVLEVWQESSWRVNQDLVPNAIPNQIRIRMDEQLLIRNPGLGGLLDRLHGSPKLCVSRDVYNAPPP